MELGFLESLVIIFGVSVLVVFFLYRIKIPSLVGFLVAGIIIGPHAIGLIKNITEIETFAEIGVILLLFALGMEFSVAKLLRMKRIVFGAGSFQVGITIFVTFIIAYLFLKFSFSQAVFWGFIITLSSTAIVIKYLNDNNEIRTPHGRTLIGIVLFQDLCVVFFSIMIPLMGGKTELNFTEIFLLLLRSGVIILFVFIGSNWLVPMMFDAIVKTRSRELFIISIMLFCVGTAVFTHKLGLSLSLGAFLAGMMLSESEYAHQATADIIPFKESFMGLFFVSVGMLLNINLAYHNIVAIVGLVVGLFIIKSIVGYFAAYFVGFTSKTSIITGLGLAQIGEFSFVLAMQGRINHLIDEKFYQIFIAASILSMIGAPFIMRYAPIISVEILRFLRIKHQFNRKNILQSEFQRKGIKENHVIIIGFGFNGKNLAKILKEANIPYVIIDSNMNVVKKHKQKGEPIFYGDATSTEVIEKLGLAKAKMVVCTISYAFTQRIIISYCRKSNPNVHIIVRTRYLKAVEDLQNLGANEVIPEEYETSIEIFNRVLSYYHVRQNDIHKIIEYTRDNNYSALWDMNLDKKIQLDFSKPIPEIDVRSFTIKSHMSIIGKSIRELDVRKNTGATILGIQREYELITNPHPNFTFSENDTILYTGEPESLIRTIDFFKKQTF